MASLTLVVMAAGIGSRYGGLKQVDSVGPSGEIVIDYSIYDALGAGFDRIVFVIRREIEKTFREKIGRTIEARMDTAYVFQDLDKLPGGFALPPERKKPWGTAHAILCCRSEVRTPFAAINADDFYGRTAFQLLASRLRLSAGRSGEYALAGYILGNTLSEHGPVARGICEAGPDGYLRDLHERRKVMKFPDGIKYTENDAVWIDLSADSFVSMNMWGFLPDLFDELESGFPVFLREKASRIEKSEFLIPEIVGAMVRDGKARVKILPVREKWFGVTYPEDRALVQSAIGRLVAGGLYPKNLWGR